MVSSFLKGDAGMNTISVRCMPQTYYNQWACATEYLGMHIVINCNVVCVHN